jgi:hypothetical protein
MNINPKKVGINILRRHIPLECMFSLEIFFLALFQCEEMDTKRIEN